ncbi:hypothetical protein BJV78DRAFT_1151039 [Lactifluus subvellereus]|nr:hypothetical protein BJV78DRAFT_1151039 [Lactifluus subvellereus]
MSPLSSLPSPPDDDNDNGSAAQTPNNPFALPPSELPPGAPRQSPINPFATPPQAIQPLPQFSPPPGPPLDVILVYKLDNEIKILCEDKSPKVFDEFVGKLMGQISNQGSSGLEVYPERQPHTAQGLSRHSGQGLLLPLSYAQHPTYNQGGAPPVAQPIHILIKHETGLDRDGMLMVTAEREQDPRVREATRNSALPSGWDVDDDGSLYKTELRPNPSASRDRRKRKAADSDDGMTFNQRRKGRLPPVRSQRNVVARGRMSE